MQNPAALT